MDLTIVALAVLWRTKLILKTGSTALISLLWLRFLGRLCVDDLFPVRFVCCSACGSVAGCRSLILSRRTVPVADVGALSNCFTGIQAIAIVLGVSCPGSPVFLP